MRKNRKQTRLTAAKYLWRQMYFVCTVAMFIIVAWLQFPEALKSMTQIDASMTPGLVAFGAYDPDKNFQQQNVLIEHKFTPWRLDNATEFIAAVKEARAANKFPMVTVEPWPWNWNWMTSETLFQDILSGKYDSTLQIIFKAAQQEAPSRILVRWGHEMEIVGQYPWAKEDSNGYIAAYRYVVEFSRKMGVTNILWVWSPAGNKEAKYYWPGPEYVDYIGVSVYADMEWDKAAGYAKTRSFEDIMAEKYWFAESYSKPMIVAEVGVNDFSEHKEPWLAAAVKSLTKFPEIKCWVYFNQIQPAIVPVSYGKPHWELTQKQVKILADSWEEFNDGRVSSKNIDEFLGKV